MNIQQLQDILRRFAAGDCTPAEQELVDKWYSELVNTGEVEWNVEQRTMMQATLENRLLQSITNEPTGALSTGRVRFMLRKMWWAAAAILVLLAGGAYFFFGNNPKKELEVVTTTPKLKNDVAPGGNKAVLTLANGTTINLDDAANGTLANEGSSEVSKTKDGELEYKSVVGPDSHREQSAVVSYNTLATPKGGQYQLVLPDGSKVWLNAASSITYPTAFIGDQRKVQITGEAYFEVVHNSKMPFIVEKGSMAVEVLGTHFNINAYDDEAEIKTTLLEGKVKVSLAVNGQRAILKPGEQVSASHSSQLSQPIPVQTEEVMAWKNGLFHFEHADLKTVMRQLARWYDVDIVYKSPTQKSDPLFIDMSRNANLSDVLKALEVSGSARFSIEGKKIIVL